MTRICMLDEIDDGDARGFTVDGQSLVIARRDGQVYAYRNICPHLGIELNFQPDEFLDLDRQYLQCANHGALFAMENGYCLLGPCKGQSLQKVDATVSDGAILVQWD